MSGRHPDASGEGGRPQVVVRVRGDGGSEDADGSLARLRCRGEHAHLTLIAGSLHVDDEVPGHPARRLRAVVLLDEGQGQVQRAGDAGRRVHVAVADPPGRLVHPYIRVGVRQVWGELPVGGGPSVVEETCRGQHGRARTARCDPAAYAAEAPDVADEAGVRGEPSDAQPARDDERVQRPLRPLQGGDTCQREPGHRTGWRPRPGRSPARGTACRGRTAFRPPRPPAG